MDVDAEYTNQTYFNSTTNSTNSFSSDNGELLSGVIIGLGGILTILGICCCCCTKNQPTRTLPWVRISS